MYGIGFRPHFYHTNHHNFSTKMLHLHSLHRYSLVALLLTVVSLLAGQQVCAQSLRTAKVSVVLPFQNEGGSNDRYLEFYRGYLLAADALKAIGYNIQITAVREPADNTDMSTTLQSAMEGADMLIGPVHRSHLLQAAKLADSRQTILLSPFAQYIPQELANNTHCVFNLQESSQLEEQYATILTSVLGKCTLLYISAQHPTHALQVNNLAAALVKRGCKLKRVPPTTPLTDLDNFLSAKNNNLILTDSDSPEHLQPFTKLMAEYATAHPKYSISMALYPQTDIATEQAVPQCNGLDIYLPTLSYQPSNDALVAQITAAYQKWFHCSPLNEIPAYAIRGYECGIVTLSGLAHHGAEFMAKAPVYPPILTCGHYVQDHKQSCWTLGSLRLLHSKQDGSVEVLEMKR